MEVIVEKTLDMAGAEARQAIIGIGSNLAFGPWSSAALIPAALHALHDAGLPSLRVSRLWRTAPVAASGAEAFGQPVFHNAVAVVEAGPAFAGAQAVLAALWAVERAFGRDRAQPYAPRTLDLDLLDFAGEVHPGGPGADLILPHPRLHLRAFVLGPLCDVAPNWRHPVLGLTGAELYVRLPPGPPATPIDAPIDVPIGDAVVANGAGSA